MKNLNTPRMVEPIDAIFEEREELMVSPTGGNPTLRTAHFLKPSVSSIDELPSPFHSAEPTISDVENLPLKLHFKGWHRIDEKWKMWVASLHSKYQSIWKEVGIYEAIMSSKYFISKHQDLVLGLAEKWCPKTNAFIFAWGEAIVTLEDMMALGATLFWVTLFYKALFLPKRWKKSMKSCSKHTKQFRTVASTPVNKPSWNILWGLGVKLSMKHSFLSYWLSRFVFPMPLCRIGKQNFPNATLLARGTRIALASAVLSSIYTDLGLLKEKLVASTKLDTEEVNLFAPFQFVQLWAWERFPALQPSPISITQCEPRLARWSKLKK